MGMATLIMEYEPIIDILEDILGGHHMHNDYKGQMSFDCPVCSYDIKGLDDGDGKGNLEVNYRRGVYKCWSCAETHNTYGSLYKLIKKHGNAKHLKNYELLRPEEDEDGNKRVYNKVQLPKEYNSFDKASAGLKLTPQYRQAWNYIKKRNITDQMITRYNIGFCYEGPYAFRIIIPSYDEYFKLNYFIARSYLTKPYMKYKNPEVQKEIIIWNEYNIKWEDPVYIVEGAFDSIFLPNSVPMLGKFMSEHLFNKIYDNATKVVIVLDGDAWNDAELLFHKLNCGKLMGRVWIIKLPVEQDIADLQGKLGDYKEFKLE